MTDTEILARLENLAGELSPAFVAEWREPSPGDQWPPSQESFERFFHCVAPMLTGRPESVKERQALTAESFSLLERLERGEIVLSSVDRPAMDIELIAHGSPALWRVVYDALVERDRRLTAAAERGERVCVCGRVLQPGESCDGPITVGSS